MSKKVTEIIIFSKKQLNGLAILALIIMVFFAASFFIENHYKPKDLNAAHLVKYKEIIYLAEENTSDKVPQAYKNQYSRKGEVQMQAFDPNKMSLQDWVNLGLSEKQSQTILNYLGKGGRFKTAEDLRKMYVINERFYQQVLPYVQIENGGAGRINSDFSNQHFQQKNTTFDRININVADSLTLLSIKGIGPTFARRIMAYRKRIGGFTKPSQLLEVYGIDSVKLLELQPQIFFGGDLTLIPINSVSFDELRKHPYLNYNQAQSIVNYRDHHGRFETIEDLKRVKILDERLLMRLTPYLLFNHD